MAKGVAQGVAQGMGMGQKSQVQSMHVTARSGDSVMIDCQQRFVSLWQSVSRADDDTSADYSHTGSTRYAERLYDDIVQRYAESQRRYHTFAHIVHCLEQISLVSDIIPNADAVELAIWFHDVIYDPVATNNERESADWFRQCAQGMLPLALIDDVDRLIMATVHAHMPERDDEAYLVDIDLSSFGLPWAKFRQDSKAVREESEHLSDNDYGVQQKRFLKRLLDRRAIYSTDYFNQRYDQVARENITQYLQELD